MIPPLIRKLIARREANLRKCPGCGKPAPRGEFCTDECYLEHRSDTAY